MAETEAECDKTKEAINQTPDGADGQESNFFWLTQEQPESAGEVSNTVSGQHVQAAVLENILAPMVLAQSSEDHS